MEGSGGEAPPELRVLSKALRACPAHALPSQEAAERGTGGESLGEALVDPGLRFPVLLRSFPTLDAPTEDRRVRLVLAGGRSRELRCPPGTSVTSRRALPVLGVKEFAFSSLLGCPSLRAGG